VRLALERPPEGGVRFGREAFPINQGDKADVTIWPKFPGA